MSTKKKTPAVRRTEAVMNVAVMHELSKQIEDWMKEARFVSYRGDNPAPLSKRINAYSDMFASIARYVEAVETIKRYLDKANHPIGLCEVMAFCDEVFKVFDKTLGCTIANRTVCVCNEVVYPDLFCTRMVEAYRLLMGVIQQIDACIYSTGEMEGK